MTFAIFRNLPSIGQDIVTLEHAKVTVSEAYESIIARLNALLEEAGRLNNTIQNEVEYEEAKSALSSVKRFRQDIDLAFKPVEAELARVGYNIGHCKSLLEAPATNLATLLDGEASRYALESERKAQEASERARKAEEAAQAKEQRKTDLMMLRRVLAYARQVADNFEIFGHSETAGEIRKGLQRFANLDSTPDSYRDPAKDAFQVRELVSTCMGRDIEREKKGMAGG